MIFWHAPRKPAGRLTRFSRNWPRAEIAERSRRSLERRLRLSGIKRFKPMADFEWSWPTKIDRDVIERALTLDFLPEARNLVLVGRNDPAT